VSGDVFGVISDGLGVIVDVFVEVTVDNHETLAGAWSAGDGRNEGISLKRCQKMDLRKTFYVSNRGDIKRLYFE